MTTSTASVNITTCRELDFFRQQKEEGFHGSLPSMQKLATWLVGQLTDLEKSPTKPEELGKKWQTLVQICLWGNR